MIATACARYLTVRSHGWSGVVLAAGQGGSDRTVRCAAGVLDCGRGGGNVIGYRLLGPLEVTVDGVPADLGGRRQRALLAILLLHVNQPVHRDGLVDQLWGEHPPAAAGHALNVYIWRLRKTLYTAASTPAVLTRRGAYLLQAAEEQIDVAAFGRLAREGQGALAAG